MSQTINSPSVFGSENVDSTQLSQDETISLNHFQLWTKSSSALWERRESGRWTWVLHFLFPQMYGSGSEQKQTHTNKHRQTLEQKRKRAKIIKCAFACLVFRKWHCSWWAALDSELLNSPPPLSEGELDKHKKKKSDKVWIGGTEKGRERMSRMELTEEEPERLHCVCVKGHD